MCGICGVAYRDPARPVQLETITRMNDALSHRGPDAEGIKTFGNVALGHRRLSIVDLAGGRQPMSNEDGSVWLTYNGEIYNHDELRGGLISAGHTFATRCDTEAIVHSYEERGAARSAQELRGMFAYGLWDTRTRTLVLARDRIGIKPLYYATTDQGDLYFASEPASLLASGEVSGELDRQAMQVYFAQGHVPGERTLYRDIRKLDPGSVLTWKDGRLTKESFSPPPPDVSASQDLDAAADEFWQRFCESVRMRLMSDVPVGVFLSGGLDSSLLVAAVREIGHPALATFSVGYEHAEADEIPFAQTVAAAHECPHEFVRIDEDDFFGDLPTLTRRLGQPLTFHASPPLFAVSKLARSHGVKVVLAGEGSDEIFSGYGRYAKALMNYRLARLMDRLSPEAARRWIRSGTLALQGGGRLVEQLQRTFLARRGGLDDAYLDAFAVFREEQRSRLLRTGAATGAYDAYLEGVDPELLAAHPLEAMLRLDQSTYLQELLAKQDHMSMAASIETRVPFLDHELVRWSRTLPASVKMRGASGKLLAKRAARGRLPDSIIDASKRGFLVPMARWFAPQGRARTMLEDRLPGMDEDLLDPGYVRRLLDEHASGRDHTTRLWTVLAFELWRDAFVTPGR